MIPSQDDSITKIFYNTNKPKNRSIVLFYLELFSFSIQVGNKKNSQNQKKRKNQKKDFIFFLRYLRIVIIEIRAITENT